MRNDTAPFVIVCVVADAAERETLRSQVEIAAGEPFVAEACPTATAALARVAALEATGVVVPVVLAADPLPDGAAVDLLLGLGRRGRGRGRDTRKVLVAADVRVEDLARALHHRAVDAVLARPWSAERVRETLDALLPEFFSEHADARIASAERAAAGHRARAADRQLERLKRTFFGDRAVSDEVAVAEVIEEVDRVLDHPPRRAFERGAVVLRSGDPVDGVLILERGRVRLTLEIDGREEVFHSRTAGRIIGLFALTLDRPSFFNVVAETDVVVVPVSQEQLDAALQSSPSLAVHFVTVVLRSLGRRALRGIEQHMEIERLNRRIASERDRLATTLERLERTQARLIESEKMATLGQLVAGIAHELNNPVAAITRAVDFLQEDLAAVTAGHGEGERLEAMLEVARGSRPMSTRAERAARRRLAGELGDEPLARRLVQIGLTTPEAYEQHVGGLDERRRAARLAELERYHRLGSSLRNVASAGGRIAALVLGLRSYVRGDRELVPGVDVHESLEETLLLLGHELHDVEVVRDYGEVPALTCCPGQLNQVWTNLVTNAIEAMGGAGVLTVRTRTADGDRVQVEVIDGGPGIAPEHVERIFELHFTTRRSRVDFGLGLGLWIGRDVVRRHGGTIRVTSRPGRTCFTVVLPVEAQEADEADEAVQA